jgi:hypothetical protein
MNRCFTLHCTKVCPSDELATFPCPSVPIFANLRPAPLLTFSSLDLPSSDSWGVNCKRFLRWQHKGSVLDMCGGVVHDSCAYFFSNKRQSPFESNAEPRFRITTLTTANPPSNHPFVLISPRTTSSPRTTNSLSEVTIFQPPPPHPPNGSHEVDGSFSRFPASICFPLPQERRHLRRCGSRGLC